MKFYPIHWLLKAIFWILFLQIIVSLIAVWDKEKKKSKKRRQPPYEWGNIIAKPYRLKPLLMPLYM